MRAFCQWVVMAVGLALTLGMPVHAQQLKVCQSTFALCTIAHCDPIPGSDKEVMCHCTVNTAVSAGAEACTGVQDTPQGKLLHSRYYPVKSYAVCSNNRPWAWCLDKPCLVDKINPEAADRRIDHRPEGLQRAAVFLDPPVEQVVWRDRAGRLRARRSGAPEYRDWRARMPPW